MKNTCPENFLSTFLTFQTPYLPHTKSDWVDSSWRLFVIESPTFSKWLGSCLIDFSRWFTQKTEPAREKKVVLFSMCFLLSIAPICLGFLLLYMCYCFMKAMMKNGFEIIPNQMSICGQMLTSFLDSRFSTCLWVVLWLEWIIRLFETCLILVDD